jgi:hypothetical protein
MNNSLAGVQQATAAAYKTQIAMWAASAVSLKRFSIYDLMIGTNSNPGDNEIEWDISRQTAAGTATAATPNPLQQADGAALTVANLNATVEGTITANSSVFYLGINQRASYRWIAAPGSELVAPAVNLAGFAMRGRSLGYTGTLTASALFSE